MGALYPQADDLLVGDTGTGGRLVVPRESEGAQGDLSGGRARTEIVRIPKGSLSFCQLATPLGTPSTVETVTTCWR